ncbi:MAG: methyltransferase domain-containing protein [Leptolyngbyaceae cyanobacterium SM2_5_2]|nr:methyltransferase domain-containing protein [Leptolyngbyaceae cyanobacterium SM2_5_2]
MFSPLTGYIGRATIAITETRLPVGARILDIACGSGALLIPAIERAMHKRKAGGLDKVVGCDFSPGMVALARAKAERVGDSEVFDCEVHDGQALGFDDQSFDAAFFLFWYLLVRESPERLARSCANPQERGRVRHNLLDGS